jgi:endonuclease/exonuclease/phosphatase family metal-dependent hydrolase
VAELVVVSWNLQGRSARHLRLADALEQWQPDVLCLQEANEDKLDAVLPPTFQSRLWWPTAGTPPGIVIASHFALEEQGLLGASDPPWDRPRVAWARLRLADGPLTVVSAHLVAPLAPGRRGRRNAQRLALASWATELVTSGERLVIAGDFNTHNPTLSGMTDASGAAPRATWRPLARTWLRAVLRLDAIFVANGLTVRGAVVGDGWRGSDHLPIVARIGLGREAKAT